MFSKDNKLSLLSCLPKLSKLFNILNCQKNVVFHIIILKNIFNKSPLSLVLVFFL